MPLSGNCSADNTAAAAQQHGSQDDNNSAHQHNPLTAYYALWIKKAGLMAGFLLNS